MSDCVASDLCVCVCVCVGVYIHAGFVGMCAQVYNCVCSCSACLCELNLICLSFCVCVCVCMCQILPRPETCYCNCGSRHVKAGDGEGFQPVSQQDGKSRGVPPQTHTLQNTPHCETDHTRTHTSYIPPNNTAFTQTVTMGPNASSLTKAQAPYTSLTIDHICTSLNKLKPHCEERLTGKHFSNTYFIITFTSMCNL